MPDNSEITSLLLAWSEGDSDSLEQVLPLVEFELRRIAHSYMRRESEEHTLQTTALINEAYLKLLKGNHPRWESRAHFFGIAANIMRRILINYARDRVAKKRGGSKKDLNIDEIPVISAEKSEELLALDDALTRLASFDPLKSQIVELKFYGGMTASEIANVLGIATPTVKLHWRLAKAWLATEIRDDG